MIEFLVTLLSNNNFINENSIIYKYIYICYLSLEIIIIMDNAFHIQNIHISSDCIIPIR